jgi:hypothetical protein
VVNLVIPKSEFPAVTPPPACPGTPSAPEAKPGNLCVYVVLLSPNSGGDFFVGDPTAPTTTGVKFNIESQVTTLLGDGRASLFGFMASHTVAVTGGPSVYGTWAVTG